MRRRVSRTDQLGRTARYRHDAAGHLIALVAPDGHSIVPERDVRGLVDRVLVDDTEVFGYERDAVGRVVAVSEPVGPVAQVS